MWEYSSVLLSLTSLFVSTSAYSLPPPTGKYHVGLTQTGIQHTTPNDPLAPSGTGKSFLVNVWYPTLQDPGSISRPAYDRPLAVLYEQYFASTYNITTNGVLSGVRTNVQFNKAPPLPESYNTVKLPTLLFQPPFTGPPSQCFTALLTDLASKGYIVVTLDHPYEQPFIQYPYGGPGYYGPPVDYEGTDPIYERYADIRVSDAQAFLTEFPKLVAQYGLQRTVNTTHYIAFGHSIGGAASIDELLDLQGGGHQFLGGINLDGSLIGKAGDTPSKAVDTKKPTLFMSSTRDTDEGWTGFGAEQSAWWRYYEVNGTVHTDYSDLTLWKQWIGVEKPGPTQIESHRMVALVRTWVSGFMEKIITGNKNTVVEGHSGKWPEVSLIGAKN